MVLLHYFRLLLFFSITAQGSFAGEKHLGILVQVKKKEALSYKEFKDLVAKNNLTADQYYPTLKIQSFKFNKKNENDLNSLCKTLEKKFSDVLSCEINFDLSPQSTYLTKASITDELSDCKTPSLIDLDLEKMITHPLGAIETRDCDLFNTKNPIYKIPGFDPHLSPFWAQEYIGADLLKEEMSDRKINTSNASELLAVWDSPAEKHGEKVANLIAGPFTSSLISLPKTKEIVNLEKVNEYFASYEKAYTQCQINSNCPRFINNSMGWHNSDQIKQVIGKLATEQKIVFVTGTGNDYSEVEKAKRESSRNEQSILVASYAPIGLSSDFSNFAPEVDITAPSNSQILSYTYDGTLVKFGGTSGAAPLVTSTLLAFELIAGVQLSTPQFKEILKKTAISHKNDPPRGVTGAGYLNSYKIGAIAFKLVKLCNHFSQKHERDECMMKSLKTLDLYDFSKEIEEDQILNQIKSTFPQCGGSLDSKNQNIPCDKKKMALKELRKAAFLIPENLKFWEKLACVYSLEGLSTNQGYYTRLARGKRILEEEHVIASSGEADLAELIAGGEVSRNDRDFFLKIVKRKGFALKYASNNLKNDRELVLTAVKIHGRALGHASEELRNDREIVLAATEQSASALSYASIELKNDREFALTAIKMNPYAFPQISDVLKNDREIVLNAVKEDGSFLQFVSEALKNDPEIVLNAVKKSGFALRYASKTLQNNRQVVLEAVKTNGASLNDASESLRNNRQIVLEAVKQDRSAFYYASKKLKNDPEIRTAAGIGDSK